MKDKFLLYSGIFFALLLAILSVREIMLTPDPVEQVTCRIIKQNVHDTIYLPSPTLTETVYVPVPEDVDTAAILREHFTRNIYVDTVHVGDYLDLKVTDSVFCNQLVSHEFELLSSPFVCVDVNSYVSSPGAASARCVALGALTGVDLFALKCDFSIRKHQFSAGYDFYSHAPVVGYSYKLFTW